MSSECESAGVARGSECRLGWGELELLVSIVAVWVVVVRGSVVHLLMVGSLIVANLIVANLIVASLAIASLAAAVLAVVNQFVGTVSGGSRRS